MAFVLLYGAIHHAKLLERGEMVGLVGELLQVDMLIYTPIALFNFKFIPVGLSQTAFVNATDLAIIEPLESLIINNGMRVIDLLPE